MEFETWAERVGSRARLRLTADFFEAVGPVIFIELLPVGAHVAVGGAIGLALFADQNECEISSAVAGTITAVNHEVHLREPPSVLNDDPQKTGWLVDLDTT